MSKRKIGVIVLSVFIVGLIVLRLFLPSIIVSQVNKRLAELNGYEGSISDVDLHLYRGAAKIFDIHIDKFNEDQKNPFIDVPEWEVSLEWKSLFKGAIVGEIILRMPSLNLEIKGNGDAEQTGEEVNWVDLVKDITPIRINTFKIENGQLDVDFQDSKEPQFDFDMKKIDVLVTNITNVEDRENPLPSDIKVNTSLSNYYGDLEIIAKANMLKEIPDIDLNTKLEGLDLKTLNAFMKHYVGIDFNGGELNLYSEIALKDAQYEGYIKPSLQDPVIFKAEEEDRSMWEGLKELVAEGAQEVLENQKKEQTATKIPVSGSMEGFEANFWQAFIVSIRNAYIEALKNQLDNTVAFSEVNA